MTEVQKKSRVDLTPSFSLKPIFNILTDLPNLYDEYYLPCGIMNSRRTPDPIDMMWIGSFPYDRVPSSILIANEDGSVKHNKDIVRTAFVLSSSSMGSVRLAVRKSDIIVVALKDVYKSYIVYLQIKDFTESVPEATRRKAIVHVLRVEEYSHFGDVIIYRTEHDHVLETIGEDKVKVLRKKVVYNITAEPGGNIVLDAWWNSHVETLFPLGKFFADSAHFEEALDKSFEYPSVEVLYRALQSASSKYHICSRDMYNSEGITNNPYFRHRTPVKFTINKVEDTTSVKVEVTIPYTNKLFVIIDNQEDFNKLFEPFPSLHHHKNIYNKVTNLGESITLRLVASM